MTAVLLSTLTLVVGAVVSGVLTYLGTRSKMVVDYDADLRSRRVTAYADLWARLEPLAKYAAESSFSETEAKNLATSLRVWYFQKGGLFLSQDTRADYFALQNLLMLLGGGWGWSTSERAQLTPAAREHVRTYGSRLRSSLTRDVGTRSRPRVRGDAEPVDRALAGVYERDDGQRLKLDFAPRILGGTRRISLTALGTDPRPVKVQDWSPAQLTIRAVLTDPAGRRRDRVLLIEAGQLVEGPSPDEHAPARAALWKRV
ncbi:hypothetical protein AB0L70_09660 [Kribbella sp. NPDC051952]|uniref:hypothetical protein n=1 Tax=Kribbella sp. NPDC051952 TaxID=3154851 RepID=UPI0034407744